MAGRRKHIWVSKLVGALAAGAVLLSAWPVHPQESWRWTDVPRVVVFADVHGAYSALADLLQATGLIDSDLSWVGGGTHAVSLGDLLDRGPDARKVLDLLMRLQREALEDGGRFHVVLGNHEVMNLLGDLRYVSAPDYAAFAAEEPDAVRAAAYAAFAAAAGGNDAAATRALFDRTHPRGYFARHDAFAANGRYGAWLLSLPAIVIVNDTAYVHGGLPPIVAEAGLGVNAKLQADLGRYLQLRERLVAEALLPATDMQRDPETARAALATAGAELAPVLEEFVALGDAAELSVGGPLWYRGSVYCKPLLEETTLDAALARLNVARAVIGHTPTGDRRVRSLYDGRIVMLDTGMLADYYRGRPAALVLEGGETYVQYTAPLQRAAVETSGNAQVYGRTEAQLREALEQGTVAAVERGAGGGPWEVVLRYAGVTIDAWFYPRSGNGGGDLELAAGALDDLLGMALVAPTVPRSLDGEPGALQLRYPDAITETERLERKLGFAGWCPIEPQLELLYVFDVLTFNRGRSTDNVVYGNELSDLTATDHRHAFGTERSLPAGFDPRKLTIPAPLADTLRGLDEARLKAALGTWLNSRRIRALLARRDSLVMD